ncbi:MAG: hypothetical protein S4CHLAM7_10040 [Chlamydiae bacterium]|nr:hypothetical protein [Chlamydiota bacterium]
MKVTHDLKDLSNQFAQYFTNKDIHGISELLHKDCSLFDPALKWVRGKENILAILKEGFDTHCYISYKIFETFQENDTTILKFEIVMDDNHFVGVDFMKWENEKMIELVCYYNPPEKE